MALKRPWLKQVEDDIRNHRINLDEARIIANDRHAWKQVVKEIRPLALTAAYGLRSQSRPNASQGSKKKKL